MKPLFRIVSIALRTLQMMVWGVVGAGVFACRVIVENVEDGRFNRSATLRGLARAMRIMLEGLGATFVKVGQIMSTRPDLLPPEIIAELALLQENVRPFAAAEAGRIIEEDLRRPLNVIFDHFDAMPIASASVAQVHRAR